MTSDFCSSSRHRLLFLSDCIMLSRHFATVFIFTICATRFALSVAEPDVPDRVILRQRATCTPVSQGNTSEDDTPAIQAAIKSCGAGGTIVLPSGTIYSLRSMLTFSGCTNCDVQIEGTLKASDNTTYWATQTTMIYLDGISGATIRSVTGSGVIDANGQDSYDLFAEDSSLMRPTVLYVVGGSDIKITGFTIKNPPNMFISQKGGVKNINYASLTMTAASKSTNAPKNTDGFDIGESTYTTIKSVYISNQDDCVAFKSGCNYVTVDGISCAGTTHGLSVGSLVETNADSVKNVYVSDATMTGCSKAAGIKLYPVGSNHGTATVSNVTWDGLTISECDYGAQIQSCYAGLHQSALQPLVPHL